MSDLEQLTPIDAPVQQEQPQQRFRRVLIGTASYDGKTEAWYNDSMYTTIKIGLMNGFDILPLTICYDAMVQNARNDLIQTFVLDESLDDLIFIDADQSWDPQWVFSLLSRPQDVIGGTVVKKSDEPGFNVKLLPGDPKLELDGTMKVSYVGTGFLKVSRKAATAVYNISEPYNHSNKSNRMTFDLKIIDGDLVSEDNVFCQKWKDLGGEVFIDPNMTCSHIGVKKYQGDFMAYLNWIEHQKAEAKTAQVAPHAVDESSQVVAAELDPEIGNDLNSEAQAAILDANVVTDVDFKEVHALTSEESPISLQTY